VKEREKGISRKPSSAWEKVDRKTTEIQALVSG